MKYIKTHEDLDLSTLRVGDKVYCIDNSSVDLEIGKEYTIKELFRDRGQFRLTDDSKWMEFRFTKDINHPNIVKAHAKKYNI